MYVYNVEFVERYLGAIMKKPHSICRLRETKREIREKRERERERE